MIGTTIIWHFHKLDLQNLDDLNQLNDKRANRSVTLPPGSVNYLKKAGSKDEVHY